MMVIECADDAREGDGGDYFDDFAAYSVGDEDGGHGDDDDGTNGHD
jgi:hypothetical protein